ncbi:hypothetical protein QJU96_03100 [Pasteurella skyensis]|uniref:hypothetical protein n=1 Tax=Phocoenobacter skyensis TaxID=97481 RepID=UPI002791F58B|nr:hypothetical protein [Pasteurella skyensis]MDP8170278.1 hypothetical protein [Pasteurella skyensis]
MTNSVTYLDQPKKKFRKPEQFLKVTKLLITGSFSSLDSQMLWQISPRNKIYDLEKMLPLGMEIKRTKTKNPNCEECKAYNVYSIPDLKTMKKVIEIYKSRGGELTEIEEQYALSRFKDEPKEQGANDELFN